MPCCVSLGIAFIAPHSIEQKKSLFFPVLLCAVCACWPNVVCPSVVHCLLFDVYWLIIFMIVGLGPFCKHFSYCVESALNFVMCLLSSFCRVLVSLWMSGPCQDTLKLFLLSILCFAIRLLFLNSSWYNHSFYVLKIESLSPLSTSNFAHQI
jgi:hypothetical protein